LANYEWAMQNVHQKCADYHLPFIEDTLSSLTGLLELDFLFIHLVLLLILYLFCCTL
jgi:hypothetical protein